MHSDGVLHYTVTRTHVGRVIVLMSEQGVVDMLLLPRRFTAEAYLELISPWFAGTRFIRDDGSRWQWVEAAASRFNGVHAEKDAPVDLRWSSREPLELAAS